MNKKTAITLAIEAVIVAVIVIGIFAYFNRGKITAFIPRPSQSLPIPKHGVLANIIDGNKIIVAETGNLVLAGKVKSIIPSSRYTEIVFADPNFPPVQLNNESIVGVLNPKAKLNTSLSNVLPGDSVLLRASYDFKNNKWLTNKATNL